MDSYQQSVPGDGGWLFFDRSWMCTSPRKRGNARGATGGRAPLLDPRTINFHVAILSPSHNSNNVNSLTSDPTSK